MEENSPLGSSRGREKVTILKYIQNILAYSTQAYSQGKIFMESNQSEFYKGLPDMGEGKHPSPVPSGLPL